MSKPETPPAKLRLHELTLAVGVTSRRLAALTAELAKRLAPPGEGTAYRPRRGDTPERACAETIRDAGLERMVGAVKAKPAREPLQPARTVAQVADAVDVSDPPMVGATTTRNRITGSRGAHRVQGPSNLEPHPTRTPLARGAGGVVVRVDRAAGVRIVECYTCPTEFEVPLVRGRAPRQCPTCRKAHA